MHKLHVCGEGIIVHLSSNEMLLHIYDQVKAYITSRIELSFTTLNDNKEILQSMSRGRRAHNYRERAEVAERAASEANASAAEMQGKLQALQHEMELAAGYQVRLADVEAELAKLQALRRKTAAETKQYKVKLSFQMLGLPVPRERVSLLSLDLELCRLMLRLR